MVSVNSIPSAEVFGTPTVAGPITAESLASSEAFGSPTLAGPITADGLASDEAFGTLQVSLAVVVDGIATAEALGVPAVALASYAGSIPSAEAFGSPQLDLTIYPAGLVSAEAFGDVLTHRTIGVDSVPSGEMFGVPLMRLTVHLSGLASTSVVGTPIVAGPITAVGIGSAEAFGLPELFNYGVFRVLQGGRGDIEGLAVAQLAGAVLNMRPCLDDFSDAVLNSSLWTDVSSGGGFVAEAENSLSLDTGTGVGAVAGIRSTDTGTYFDVEARFDVTRVQLPVQTVIRPATLGLYVSVGNEFRVDLETDRTQQLIARITSTIGGVTDVSQTFGVGQVVEATVLRLLRVGPRVLAFVNGSRVMDAPWLAASSAFQFSTANATAVSGTRVRTRVSSYLRRPVILFGAEPAEAMTLGSPGVIEARVPSADRPQTVDLVAYGCAFTETIVGGFTYVVENRRVVGRSATSQLVVLNDRVLKEN